MSAILLTPSLISYSRKSEYLAVLLRIQKLSKTASVKKNKMHIYFGSSQKIDIMQAKNLLNFYIKVLKDVGLILANS